MEFKSIEIENFRPYRSAEVDLTKRDGHIHIIEGPQGAGKTSLQTAIQWALYHRNWGRRSDFVRNWNETAKKSSYRKGVVEEDHELRVSINFEEAERSYELIRYGTGYRFQQKEVETKLKLVEDGEETYTGAAAQTIVNDFLPPDLARFFLLDGEEIQELIEDETGQEAKEDIETVLKHQAIIEGESHLKNNILSEYRKQRDSLQKEREERDKLLDEITTKEAKIEENKARIKEDESELEQLRNTMSRTRNALKKYDEELNEEIERKDELIKSKTQERTKLIEEFKEAWKETPFAIVAPEIRQAILKITQQLEGLDNRFEEEQRNYFLQEFRTKANEGECPVCGATEGHLLEDHTRSNQEWPDEENLERRRIEARDKLNSLQQTTTDGTSPVILKNKIDTISSEIENLEEERSKLQREFGGYVSDSEKESLESDLNSLEDQEDNLMTETSDLRQEISTLEDKIGELRRQRKQKSGKSDVDDVEEKIELIERIINHFQDIRKHHIEKKRSRIKNEMNKVFNTVAKSEFISRRYSGIDFKDGDHDKEMFVIQLLDDGENPKDMNNHPPSAGEAQLTALSFIFGLNAFAKYSTTVVFDTVAGRLDLTNSSAQGRFFAGLPEPIILLVTDAEYRDMANAIEDDIGAYYRIKPTEDTNSKLVEVNY